MNTTTGWRSRITASFFFNVFIVTSYFEKSGSNDVEEYIFMRYTL